MRMVSILDSTIMSEIEAKKGRICIPNYRTTNDLLDDRPGQDG